MATGNPNQETFNSGRACHFCGQPIADQAHAAQKYCKRTVRTDGTVKCCKDDHHAKLRKQQDAPFKRIAEYHRTAYANIHRLYKAKGEYVTAEDINRHGIDLNRRLSGIRNGDIFTMYFHGFAFVDSDKQNFKIITHELY